MRDTNQASSHLLDTLSGIRPDRLSPEAAKRYHCVWMRLALGLPAPRIAQTLKLNPSTVRHIHSAFFRYGAAAILGRGNRGGRRRALMTLEQECAFLHTLASGSLHLKTHAVAEALGKALGKGVDASTVRCLLRRHGWRKTMGLEHIRK